jgi:DNA invertase Pin-like site-specific DNA recombinase
MQACHDPDHSPANCDVGNLRWGTPQSNYADRDRHGRTAKGERHGQAKLTAEQAQAIRSRYRAGGTSERKLAAEFGVGRTTVRDILTGHSWRPS